AADYVPRGTAVTARIIAREGPAPRCWRKCDRPEWMVERGVPAAWLHTEQFELCPAGGATRRRGARGARRTRQFALGRWCPGFDAGRNRATRVPAGPNR